MFNMKAIVLLWEKQHDFVVFNRNQLQKNIGTLKQKRDKPLISQQQNTILYLWHA